MKKCKKLLRKLLDGYRQGLVSKPYTNERSRLVDCATILIEAINEQNRNS